MWYLFWVEGNEYHSGKFSIIYLLERVAIGIILLRRQFRTGTCCIWKNKDSVSHSFVP